MILKSYEINKINLDNHKIILLYGKNEGHKNESIKLITMLIQYIEIEKLNMQLLKYQRTMLSKYSHSRKMLKKWLKV